MVAKVISAIIGIILGWYGKDWIRSIVKKFQKMKNERRKVVLQEKANRWLINYYDKKGLGDYLFKLRTGARIPYLTKKDWYGDGLKTRKLKFNVSIKERDISPVKVANKVIWYRKYILGQNIWNDPVLLFNSMDINNMEVCLNIITGNYFQYLSSCGKLEDELYRCLLSGNEKPEFRDRVFDTIENLSNTDLLAQNYGFSCSLVFKKDGKYKVFIQERKHNTGVGSGMYAVVPSFVCDPEKFEKIKIDFNLHFFLKEFYEELYDKEELVKRNKKMNPDWFYKYDPVKSLLNFHKEGKFKFEILGFGFDGWTGEFNLAAMAIIDEEGFCENEVDRMWPNWEIKSFDLVDINTDKLLPHICSDEMYNTCAFNLSLLLYRFNNTNK